MSVPLHSRPDTETPVRPYGLRRAVPLMIVATALVFIYASGLHRELSFEALVRHHATISAFVAQHEAAAFAAYVALYISVVAVSVPGAFVLTVTGGAVFGTLLGAVGAIVAATIGATIIFLIARGAVGEILIRRAGPKLGKLAAGFREDAFCYLLFLRLVPLFPLWLVNLVPAIAGVRLLPFVTATAIGIIPGCFAFALFGSSIDSALDAQTVAYQACLATGQEDCRLALHVHSLLTPRVAVAFVLLGLFALIPVLVKRYKGSQRL